MKLVVSLATVALGLALGAALQGATRAPSGDGELRSFRRNLTRWNGFDAGQQGELRARWQRWIALPSLQREQVEARYAVLGRLRQRLRIPGSSGPALERVGAELTRDLEGLPQQLRREIPDAPSDISLPDAVEILFRRRMAAFLDHQQARGRLVADERTRLLALPVPDLANEGLARLQAEYVRLCSGQIAEAFAARDARDLAAGIDELRRRRGFLGRAGIEWPLSAEECEELATLPNVWLVRLRVREMKAPAIRSRLGGYPLQPAAVEELLQLPWNELERSLHELLAGG